jgi:hypothetical protein
MTEPDIAAPITPPQRDVTRWMQRLAETTQSDTMDDADEARPGGLGAGILFLLGLIWLAATMWTAHASIVGNAFDPAVALGSAATALPVVIAASLLAGATAGLLATGRYAADPAGALRRMLVGLAAGAVLGTVCAGVILFGYGVHSSIVMLAVTVGAGSLLGGAAAATPRPVFAAGIAGTFTVFLVGLIFTVLQPWLTKLFGAGETIPSQAAAGRTFGYVQSAVSGIVAGLVVFWFLRRHGSRAWPWYLLAGALPGLLLLLTEALTQTGGASLLGIVKGFSEGDRAAVDFLDFARLRNALVVVFASGLTSMIAVGRTMRTADD